MKIIGKARRRVDGRAKVTGQTRFADDIVLPRMLHGRLLRSPHPHARIVKIDTSKAAAHPGVHLVLTGEAFPIPYGILPVSHDEHALCPDKVRFVGDPVAAVIARDEITAAEAIALIDVEYELLRTIASPEDSLAHPEPRIHDYGDEGNIHKLVALQFGDVDAAIAGAAHVFDDVFFFEGNTHLPLEQHSAVGRQGSGRQARRLFEHADAALPASRAGQGAGDAGRAHPRHRDAERRRLRRQERPVQPRGRGREGRDAAGSAGEDHAVARGSVLLPSRPAPGAHAVSHRRDGRRPDHRASICRRCSTAAPTDRTARRARSTPARCRR